MDKFKPASLDAEIERYSQQMLRDYSKAFAAQAAAPVSAPKKEPMVAPVMAAVEQAPTPIPVLAAEPALIEPMVVMPIAVEPIVMSPMAAPVTVSPAKPAVISAPPEPPKNTLTPEEEYEKYKAEHPEQGAIHTQVLTARGAFPVPNATVIISKVFDSGEYIIATQTTDAAGLTKPVLLPAPREALSEAPDPASKPYAEYKVTFTHPSFATIVSKNVPVFSGTTATQTINMVPLAALPAGKTTIEYDNAEPKGL
ncbi:MAG: hypothetical protein RSF82_12840 [Angelakisella sp.]